MFDKITAWWRSLTPKQRSAIVAFVAAAIALLGAFGVKLPDIGATHASGTVSTTVQTPTGTTTVTAPASSVEQLERTDHKDLGATTVAGDMQLAKAEGVSGAELAAGVKQVTALRGTLPSSPVPAASTSMKGCSTRFITARGNFGNRGTIAPLVIFLHQTISIDNGWAGINANIVWFNNPLAVVSIHFIIDGRYGYCAYTLPMTLKAYQVVGYNSLAIGIEVTGNQSQGYYVKGKALIKLGQLLARISRASGIPIRRAILGPGCPKVRRSGIADHMQGGACAGNHNDVSPYRTAHPGIPMIISTAERWYEQFYGGRHLEYPKVRNFGRKHRAWCKRLAIVRKNAKARGWTTHRVEVAERYKALLAPHANKCRFS